MIKTLAIETSCDDTSLAIVSYENGFFENPILRTYSQITEHQQFGGVVPEIAYRLHEEKILDLIREIGYNQIAECDFITVTKTPWLPGSLVVGNTVASMLGLFFNKPVYRVNHIYGHIFSLLLDRNVDQVPLPWTILTASGGHNELYTIEWSFAQAGIEIRRIGHSLDDAAGESFDKVARMLGGSYPGGPWISQMAAGFNPQKDSENFIPSKFSLSNGEKQLFKRILLDGKWTNTKQDQIETNTHNFSFSGMKSQVYQLLQKYPLETLTTEDIQEICREFQECVSDILMIKTLRAAELSTAQTIGLVGGVSANDRLFEKVSSHSSSDTLQSLRPIKKEYSTDNAAMIWVIWILQSLQFIKNTDFLA
jgi:N6-L-threonylcarbamoyladenine synthase